MQFWIALVKKVFPRLTKDDCQCVAQKLNVVDIERLTEALSIPTCDRQNLFLALYYGYVEVAQELYEKGEKDVKKASMKYYNYASDPEGGLYRTTGCMTGIPKQNVREWIHKYDGITYYFLERRTWLEEIHRDFNSTVLPKPTVPFIEDKYCLTAIKGLELDKTILEDKAAYEIPLMLRLFQYPLPLSFLKYLSQVKNKWGLVNVSNYFFNNTYYNATKEDWQWIGQMVNKNRSESLRYMISEESYPFALANGFLPPSFGPVRSRYLLDVDGTVLPNIWTNEKVKMVVQSDPQFESRLERHNGVEELICKEQETFIKLFPYIKTFRKVYLQCAYAHAHFEVIALLESKGLKLSKQCITNAVQFANLHALDYILRCHRDRMTKLYPKPSVLFKYVTKVEAINWLVENFPIAPSHIKRDMPLTKECQTRLKELNFTWYCSQEPQN